MTEARVVVEVETQPRGVHEDELARGANLQLRLRRDDLTTERRELLERTLHRGILNWIQLDCPQCGVIGVDQATASTPDVRVAPVWIGIERARRARRRRRGHGARGRHVEPPRSARFTALRTTMSFSDDAFLSAVVALGVETRPRASAAHARNS